MTWSYKRIQKTISRLLKNDSITTLDITLFFRQLTTLIAASVPIIQSCDMLEMSQKKTDLRLLIHTMKRDLLSGKTLFHTFSRHPHYFNGLICHLIRIGEHTGQLDKMLDTIALYLEKKLAFKKRIKQLLFYPCIVMSTGVVATLCMFIFVIPRFAELFQASRVSLPPLTNFIFYLAQHILQYIGLILLLLIITFFFFHHRQQSLQHYVLPILKKLPIIKTCRHTILLARFTSNLSITFAAGIPITDALKLTTNTCDDPLFGHALTEVRNKISAGLQLHSAMASTSLFPAIMIQMIKIGEQSGMLVLMLDKLTTMLEADIEQFLNRASQLVEPLIMVLLGVLIGGLVIGMYLPIFKLGSAL